MKYKPTSMDQELRVLIGKYGFRAVHEGLLREMRQTFDYLNTVFTPPAKNDIVVPVVEETIPEPITTPKHAPLDVIAVMKDTIALPPAATVPLTIDTEDEAPHDPNIKEVLITAKGAEQALQNQGQVTTKPKFDKEEQKEAVQKKRSELIAQGIVPESLLTKENLEKWIGQGMSYQRIARDFVGVPDHEVSVIAKTFGLQSAKSRYMFNNKKK